MNGALLGLITARLHRAKEAGQPIHLLPHPKTRQEAIANLKTFSSDTPTNPDKAPPAGLIPLSFDIPLQNLPRLDLPPRHLHPRRRQTHRYRISEPNTTFLSIIYDFIPKERNLSPDQIISTRPSSTPSAFTSSRSTPTTGGARVCWSTTGILRPRWGAGVSMKGRIHGRGSGWRRRFGGWREGDC